VSAAARERRILLATLLATGSIFIDISVVNVVLPDLRADLGTTLAEEQWIVNAYLVTMTAFVLPCGVLGDVHGHRRLLRVGLALFAVATLCVGLAPTPLLEIGARALQGVAAALITPASVAILRTAQRFFVRLHVCACHVSAGADAAGAMARLRPPVFWKEQDVYKRALRRLDERALARALSLLLAAERAAKSGLGRAGTLAAQRALYAIAGAQAARGGLSAWT